jgi:hypothetical protein
LEKMIKYHKLIIINRYDLWIVIRNKNWTNNKAEYPKGIQIQKCFHTLDKYKIDK